MKKINSVGYGGRIAAAAALFLIVVPLCLYIAGRFLPVPRICIRASLALGALIALFLAILLAIELRQDKRQDRYYRAHASSKLSLGDGRYECQSCGSRDVTAGDTVCRVCGIRFEQKKTGR